MKKMIIGFMAILLTMGLVFGCNDLESDDSLDNTESGNKPPHTLNDKGEIIGSVSVGNNYRPVVIPKIETWLGIEKEKPPKLSGRTVILNDNGILDVDGTPSSRHNSNSNSNNITSNAHRNDYPGIVYFWSGSPAGPGKQKEDGYLKVHETVFQRYESFVVTAQFADQYWDFLIKPYPGQAKNDQGCYIFHITKGYNDNHHINQVWINQLEKPVVDKPPVTDDPPKNPEPPTPPDKPWPDPPEPPTVDDPIIVTPPIIENNKYIIISTPSLGGAEVDTKDVWILNGSPIKTLWANGLRSANQADYDAMKSIKTADGKTATFIWDREDSWAYGISGAENIVCASRFHIDGTINEATVPFYFACDNAAAVYVNGKRVAYTTEAFSGRPTPGATTDWRFTNFSDTAFDGNKWQFMYKVDIKNELKQGYNEIIVMAANSDSNEGIWDQTNNPAGLIFACQFSTSK